MDYLKLLSNMVPHLGQMGVDALAAEFQSLAADRDKPWKQAALSLLSDAVAANGVAGIELARKAVADLFENKVPDINWANPRTASDIVAKLQNAKADDKSASNDFFVKAENTFGKVFSGMIRGLISST